MHSKIGKTLFIAFALLALAATGTAATIYWKNQNDIRETVRIFKKAVANDFADPESARFRAIHLHSSEGPISERLKMVDGAFLRDSTFGEMLSVFRNDRESLQLCGEVNAKNKLGAYVGYTPFVVLSPKKPIVLMVDYMDDFFEVTCKSNPEYVVYSESDPE